MWFQKIYIPIHGRNLPYEPHPSGSSNLALYIALNFWVFETPLHQNFSIRDTTSHKQFAGKVRQKLLKQNATLEHFVISSTF